MQNVYIWTDSLLEEYRERSPVRWEREAVRYRRLLFDTVHPLSENAVIRERKRKVYWLFHSSRLSLVHAESNVHSHWRAALGLSELLKILTWMRRFMKKICDHSYSISIETSYKSGIFSKTWLERIVEIDESERDRRGIEGAVRLERSSRRFLKIVAAVNYHFLFFRSKSVYFPSISSHVFRKRVSQLREPVNTVCDLLCSSELLNQWNNLVQRLFVSFVLI